MMVSSIRSASAVSSGGSRYRLALFACVGVWATPSATGAAWPLREPTSPAAPDRAISPAVAARIDAYVAREMQRQHIPGLELGVYRNGRPVLLKGYGLANVELSVPVRPQTIMQSGSTGKQFLAVAVMMLAREGRIDLDASLRHYLPQGPAAWDRIKIKNLLSHTSGLSEYGDDGRSDAGGLFDVRQDFSEDEIAKRIATLPILFPAGQRMVYCNTNYVLLGIIVHKVTGRPYGEFLKDRIFAPLRMTSTRLISDRDIVMNRAQGYEMEAGKLVNQAFASPTWNSTGDGALYYNVVDLAKWDRSLTDATLLDRAALQVMWTPFVLNDGKPNPEGYGYGFFRHSINGHTVIEHSGSWQGFTTMISRYPESGLTVVVLDNLDTAHARPINVERVVAGLIEPDVMPSASPPAPVQDPALAARLRAWLNSGRASPDDAGASSKSGLADARALLPAGWAGEPLTLISKDVDDDGSVEATFRLGSAGDARQIILSMTLADTIRHVSVFSDPSNR